MQEIQNLENNTEKVAPNTELPQKENWLKDLIIFILIVVFVVLPFKEFIAKPFLVSGDSMYPNIESGDYLIVDQITYRFNDIQRGDVIVFKYPENPSEYFIKRVIGLPNETVQIDGQKVTIKNSSGTFTLDEPFIQLLGNNYQSQTLGENEYWVMGDNRLQSKDSRAWGPLDKSFIVGRALVRLFPFNELDYLPAKIQY